MTQNDMERNPQGGTQPSGEDNASYRQDGDQSRRDQGNDGSQGNGSGSGQQGMPGEDRKDQGNNGQSMNDRGDSTQRGDNGQSGDAS